jgi:hypothetical protein
VGLVSGQAVRVNSSARNLDPAVTVQPVSGTVQSVSRALRAMAFAAASKQGGTAKEIAAHL